MKYLIFSICILFIHAGSAFAQNSAGTSSLPKQLKSAVKEPHKTPKSSAMDSPFSTQQFRINCEQFGGYQVIEELIEELKEEFYYTHHLMTIEDVEQLFEQIELYQTLLTYCSPV